MYTQRNLIIALFAGHGLGIEIHTDNWVVVLFSALYGTCATEIGWIDLPGWSDHNDVRFLDCFLAKFDESRLFYLSVLPFFLSQIVLLVILVASLMLLTVVLFVLVFSSTLKSTKRV